MGRLSRRKRSQGSRSYASIYDVLDAQHVVPILLANLSGDGRLDAHRIDRHDAAPDVERGEQLGNRGDLIVLLGGGRLPEHHPDVGGKRVHQVQWRGRLARRAPARLAVDG